MKSINSINELMPKQQKQNKNIQEKLEEVFRSGLNVELKKDAKRLRVKLGEIVEEVVRGENKGGNEGGYC